MRREWIICLALVVMTAAVYWPVGRFDYVNCDDPQYISANPYFQQGFTPAGIAWAFRAVVASNWHPVTCLSLMLDHQLFGNFAGGYHLVNLLFHVANTILLFLIWRQMTGEVWPSALVAALFAWHPLHVESVAWISERKDVLSTFFGLLALWAYARYAQKQSSIEGRALKGGSGSPARDFRYRILNYCLALIFFALGLMSKPMLVTWPFVLLLLDFWPLGRMTRDQRPMTKLRIPVPQRSVLNHLLLEKVPFFALAAALSVITFLVQRAAGTMKLLGPPPISERIGNALVSYVRYLGKTIWPEHLAFFYPYPGVGIVHSTTWTGWQVAGAAALLALMTTAAVWQAQRRPFLIVGWLWFLGTLVPVIGLVQVGAQAMADRYTYVPLIGVFVMVVWAGKELGGGRPYAPLARGTAMAVILAACLVTTSRQLRYWQNSEVLCRHAIEVTKHNYKAHFDLGLALITEGKKDAGIKQLRAALAIAPGFSGRSELADALLAEGKVQKATEQYREALHYTPDDPSVLNNLAWLLATSKDPKLRNGAEAVRLAERACTVTHYQMTICIGTLAAAYAEAGRFEDAIAAAQKACALARQQGETKLLQKNEKLLNLYRAHKPYRSNRT